MEDIDNADDLFLLSQNIGDLKGKINDLVEEVRKLGLRTNEEKTKEMRINNANKEEIVFNNQAK